MADRASADRACKDPNPIIDGRKANVNLAYLGAKPRVIQPGEGLDHSFMSQLQDNQGGIQRQQPECIYTHELGCSLNIWMMQAHCRVYLYDFPLEARA